MGNRGKQRVGGSHKLGRIFSACRKAFPEPLVASYKFLTLNSASVRSAREAGRSLCSDRVPRCTLWYMDLDQHPVLLACPGYVWVEASRPAVREGAGHSPRTTTKARASLALKQVRRRPFHAQDAGPSFSSISSNALSPLLFIVFFLSSFSSISSNHLSPLFLLSFSLSLFPYFYHPPFLYFVSLFVYSFIPFTIPLSFSLSSSVPLPSPLSLSFHYPQRWLIILLILPTLLALQESKRLSPSVLSIKTWMKDDCYSLLLPFPESFTPPLP